MKFVTDRIGVIVGDKGTILHTTDGGSTWSTIKTNLTENLYSVSFADELNGFAVGASGVIRPPCG